MVKDKILSFGQIVKSRAGRDAKRFFVVVGFIGEDYVLLADGDLRKIQKPKKKKKMHVQPTPVIVETFSENQLIFDADIRKVLEKYKQGP